ncbi:PP2C family protein-serine/threonine phosphatase [Xanthobacter sp. AM11]|uniref:PP2C family protein-serine/threonine phosphatase n=1 Tax=Xanthobacter sp. AM11 TaxID=3380643 RepID=UPI0039BEDCC1
MTPPTRDEAEARPLGPGEAAAAARRMAQHPYFVDFPEADLAAVIAEGEIVTAPPGTRLIHRGDTGSFALLVLEGTTVVTIDTAYERVELARHAAPAVVGEIAAITGVVRTAHVDALTPIRAVRVSAGTLDAAGQTHPALLSALMRQFGHRFETFNRAFGFYANALNALEQHDFDLRLLDELRNPLPEMVNFAHSFRRLAEAIMLRVAERREMASAAAIQRAMLPPPLPRDALGGRADICAEMRPAKNVGGDFYDYFLIDANRLVVSLGDVSGKGTPAALFMCATQTALRMELRSEKDLAHAIAAVNDLLCATNSEDLFVTLFCAVIDLSTGEVCYCNCGHTEGMVLRADGSVERAGPTGMALAILEGAQPRAARLRLAAGDRLFLFSDGLTDAVDTCEAVFGEERLDAAVAQRRHLPVGAFVPDLIDAIAAYSGEAPQFDDMTALAVAFAGPG